MSDHQNSFNLNLFVRKVAIAAFVSALIITGFYLIGHTLHFFLLVFACILVGVMFSALTNFFIKVLHLKRGWSLAIVIILFFGGLIGLGFLIAPSIAEQTDEMSKSVQEGIQKIEEKLQQYEWGKQLINQVEQGFKIKGKPAGESMFSRISTVFSSTLGTLADIIVVLFVGLFFAASPKLYKKGIVKLFPLRHRNRIQNLLYKLYKTLKWWLVGMFASMLVIGVTTGAGLFLLGLPLAIPLAIIAFLFAFIPNIGPWIAGIPIVLVGFMESPQMALYAGGLYFIAQMIESYVITPIIFKKTVDLPPALTLLVQVLFGIWGGIAGLLLAAPILAVAIVIVQELYVKDYIEKPKPEAPASSA
ncbi:MAG: AI-2E family transporter [Hymenobacteraceae bacterium]|nr:AI-2E family transporter [Hymenobacteraceae bacterium]MDX5396592.1 AI-2E family transporter [Hymenobacteraceae bacterium]MDX5444010.1 AI-2E family transporter [Hymenobacteraceae bacterium]MDX5512655.1 AI-2E family transporter [Hymenobacteraceae bacterium]